MKRIERQFSSMLVGVSVSLMIVLFGAQIVDAQGRTTGFSEGVNLGGAKCFDDDFNFGLSGRVFLEYAPYIHEIGLRLSGGYLRFNDTVALGVEPFRSEEKLMFENYYATVGLVYRLSRGMIVPFVTGNVGVYHYQKETARPAPGPVIDGVQMSPFDVVDSLEGNTFGFNLGGGVEYFMGSRTSMSLEGLFHSIYGDADTQVLDLTVMFRFFP